MTLLNPTQWNLQKNDSGRREYLLLMSQQISQIQISRKIQRISSREEEKLSIKSWKTEESGHWYHRTLVTRMNERKKNCKMYYNKVLYVLLQIFKSLFINK